MSIAALLLTLGANLGISFIKSPQLAAAISAAVTAASNIANTLANRGVSVTEPIFLTALTAAINILQAEGKLTAGEAETFTKTVTDIIAADTAAQKLIDPSLLDASHAVQPLD